MTELDRGKMLLRRSLNRLGIRHIGTGDKFPLPSSYRSILYPAQLVRDSPIALTCC